MNESLVKYLAGLLDADGSLFFDKKVTGGEIRMGLRLFLASSDAIDRGGFVASLPEITGFGSVKRRSTPRSDLKQTVWTVSGRSDLEMLLPRLIKHMVIKARHWQWLLDVWRHQRSLGYGNKVISPRDWESLQAVSRESRRSNVGPIKPKNHPTWAWVAGFLDGDGCYSFRTSRNKNMRVSVGIHASDISALEFLQKAFGGTIKEYPAKPNLRYWWRGLGPANASFALRFLPKLVKHSRLKKHKLEQMIHWHRQRLSVQKAAA